MTQGDAVMLQFLYGQVRRPEKSQTTLGWMGYSREEKTHHTGHKIKVIGNIGRKGEERQSDHKFHGRI